jgi:hypothetical protein
MVARWEMDRLRGITPPFADGRRERLQLAEIYLIRPDGSGMKNVTTTGGFCGSPKWMSESWHVLAYLPQRLSRRWTFGVRLRTRAANRGWFPSI